MSASDLAPRGGSNATELIVGGARLAPCFRLVFFLLSVIDLILVTPGTVRSRSEAPSDTIATKHLYLTPVNMYTQQKP